MPSIRVFSAAPAAAAVVLAAVMVASAVSPAAGADGGPPTCSASEPGGCFGGGAPTTKLRLSLEWFMNPDHLPLLVANRTGLFAEAGLEVEIIEPDEHFDPLKKIQSGELDVAITEPIHLVQDRAKGESVVGFGRFFHTDGGVMFLQGRGIERPRDMCQTGQKTRVQYPGAPGLGGLAIVKTMAEADGGSCDLVESFEAVNEGFYHTKALQENKADVATLIFYNFEVVEADQLGLNASYFSLKHWGVPDFCQLVFVTTPDHYSKNKEVMKRLVLAVRKASDWIKRNTADAKKIYNSWTGQKEDDKMNDAILDKTMYMFPNDQALSWDYWDNLESWLVKTGQTDRPIGTHDYWTNEVAF